MSAKHPLLALLPTVQNACDSEQARYRVRRAIGVPYEIEVDTRDGRSFSIELRDDVPHHRSDTYGGRWVVTDHDTLVDDLLPQA